MATGNPGVQQYSGQYGGGANLYEIMAMGQMGLGSPLAQSAMPQREMMVWMGDPYKESNPAPMQNVNTTTLAGVQKASANGEGQAWFTVDAAKSQVWAFQPEEMARLGDTVSRGLGWDARGQQDALIGKWSAWVDRAAYESRITGKKVTPWEVGERWADTSVASGLAAAGGGSDGWAGRTRSVTMNLTDPDSANAILDTSLQTYLGRRATPEESAAFRAALTKHERMNPDVQTTVRTGTSKDGTQRVVAKGGTDASQFASEWARGQEGAAEFQAASSFMDAFMNALDNPDTMDVVQ